MASYRLYLDWFFKSLEYHKSQSKVTATTIHSLVNENALGHFVFLIGVVFTPLSENKMIPVVVKGEIQPDIGQDLVLHKVWSCGCQTSPGISNSGNNVDSLGPYLKTKTNTKTKNKNKKQKP